MSGVELLLAILPLVIAAAEHLETRWANKALFLSSVKDQQAYDFCLELHDELSFLANTLGSVFKGRASDNPQSLISLSAEDNQAIEAVLGDKAPTFHSLLERILEGLNAIVSDKSLSLAGPGNLTEAPKSLFTRLDQLRKTMTKDGSSSTLKERFRFTRNDKTRTWALKRIKESNKKLERLLRGSLLHESIEIQKLKSKRAKPARLRRYSEPLYDKMARKWPKKDACHHHEARLCLWSCCSQPQHDMAGESLDMILSVTDVKHDGSTWQESMLLIPAEPNHGQTDSKVKFMIDGKTESTVPATKVMRQDIDEKPLCELIAQAHGHKSALQVIFDSGKLWQTQSRRKSLLTQKLQDVTLKDLLSDSTCRMQLREQRVLAVVLAHAILHCSDGPWLCQNWSKDHISFFRSDPNTDPDLGRPYLKVSFDEQSTATDNAVNLFNAHCNPTLLALGVLLLEVYLRSPIENSYVDEDLIDGEPNENTNLTTALRLLDNLDGDLYDGYKAAIQACLDCGAESFDSEDLRQKLYHDIVMPLEQELEHGFKLTPEMLPLAPSPRARRNTTV